MASNVRSPLIGTAMIVLLTFADDVVLLKYANESFDDGTILDAASVTPDVLVRLPLAPIEP